RTSVVVTTGDPRLRKARHETLKLSHLRIANGRIIRLEVSAKEVDVLAADIHRHLGHRPLVGQILRARADETVLRQDQVSFRNTRRLRYEVVRPRPARLR